MLKIRRQVVRLKLTMKMKNTWNKPMISILYMRSFHLQFFLLKILYINLLNGGHLNDTRYSKMV